VRAGLQRGEGVLVVATALHRRVMSRRVEGLGLDVQTFQRSGQLLIWDAEETLAAFMVNGVPDRGRFRAVIGQALDALAAAGFPRGRVFGEMVDLLTLDPRSYRGLVQGIVRSHSDVIPAEDYARLDRAVERAYVEIFGSHEEARELRRAFLQHFPRPATMPDAEAAILALREFVPSSADELVASARRYYYASAA
jgi:MEDS: MEthanogen/methylotroph, DcmR Sensory domain